MKQIILIISVLMFMNIGNKNGEDNKKNETNYPLFSIEKEDDLILESWMMDDNFWYIEMEEKLELETWMIDEKIWK